MKRQILHKTFLASFVSLLCGLFLIAQTPAQAAYYVRGSGDADDDFRQAGLDNNLARYEKGDLVKFWQSILYADGYYSSISEVDGSFGDRTYAATKRWQYDHGFRGSDVDGQVGPKTWDRASDKLQIIDDENTAVHSIRVTYWGKYRYLPLYRGAEYNSGGMGNYRTFVTYNGYTKWMYIPTTGSTFGSYKPVIVPRGQGAPFAYCSIDHGC